MVEQVRVEYERWLIAKGSIFSPSSAAVAKLVERLRKERWIASPGSPELARLRFQGKREQLAAVTGGYAARTVENRFGDDAAAKLAASTEAQPARLTTEWLDDADREELRLVWPVEVDEPLPLQYPLTSQPAGIVRYALEVHRAHDYVYPGRENIGPLPSVCACGEELGFEWDEDELVPAFGASTGIFAECEACSRTFDPSRGSATVESPFDRTREEVRGGAAYRFALKIDCGKCFVPDARLRFAPELVALIEDEFGRAFFEVGALR
jgi:hypothetical protein